MTGTSTETPAGLMRLAADGDEVAFARIVDAHHADMSSVCFVITGGDADLAEEAVQSAWLIAWRKLHTVRDPERLRPWLVSVRPLVPVISTSATRWRASSRRIGRSSRCATSLASTPRSWRARWA